MSMFSLFVEMLDSIFWVRQDRKKGFQLVSQERGWQIFLFNVAK